MYMHQGMVLDCSSLLENGLSARRKKKKKKDEDNNKIIELAIARKYNCFVGYLSILCHCFHKLHIPSKTSYCKLTSFIMEYDHFMQLIHFFSETDS